MTGRVHAAVRLLRCTAHVVHGVVIVLTRFRRLDAAARRTRVQWWALKLLRLIGVALQVDGTPHPGGVLIAANHVSWLDIHAIHAVWPQARFVSKAAVKGWPLLSQLADAGGTLYLERERKRDALRVVQAMDRALGAGETVAIFPEGTTSDGRGVLPFHANLLQSAVATSVLVQPVALRFSDVNSDASLAVEYIGETTLLQSMWRVARADGLTVHVAILPVLQSRGAERRVLARQLQSGIGDALARQGQAGTQALP